MRSSKHKKICKNIDDLNKTNNKLDLIYRYKLCIADHDFTI